MAHFKTNEIVHFLKLLTMVVMVMFCVGLTACLDLEEEDAVSSTAANEDEPEAKDGIPRKDGMTGLFAEEITEFTKTDVYGAFANQYSLMYEDFSYEDEEGTILTIPMPFPLIIANKCDSSKESCDLKKVMVKSWISSFTDTSTITLVLDVNEDTIVSPSFTFDDNALLALTSPKKVQRQTEAYALENGQKNLFYTNSTSVTIHPMQVFGQKEEAFYSVDYLSHPQKEYDWYSVFVTPEADSISAMVAEVARKLPGGQLLVYQQYSEDSSVEQSLKRVVKAVFEVLQSRGIKYIEETGTSSVGQRINYPVETLRKKQGICIETAVLFASILEKLGFDARIIIVPGHAFVGWMQEDNGWMMKNSGGKIDLIETTLIADKYATFVDANNEGILKFNEQSKQINSESGSSSVVCIKQARLKGIMPNNIP